MALGLPLAARRPSADEAVSYAPAAVIFGPADVPPTIELTKPNIAKIAKKGVATIRWRDSDPDSNATIALYYDTDRQGTDGTLIVDGLQEDPNGPANKYIWDISALLAGEYFVYGVISDDISSASSYAPGSVIVP